MARVTSSLAWLVAALIVVAGGDAAADELMAEIVPRADDVSLKLSIENIDGKVVNVPETHIRRIPPGDHYLGIKIEFRNVSAGSLLTGLAAFSAIAGAIDEKPPAHEALSFTALPGHRYLVNGAVVDGKPTVWIDVEYSGLNPDDDRK
jgi:hypothetical protein